MLCRENEEEMRVLMTQFCNLNWWHDGPELEFTSPNHVLVLKHRRKEPGLTRQAGWKRVGAEGCTSIICAAGTG